MIMIMIIFMDLIELIKVGEGVKDLGRRGARRRTVPKIGPKIQIGP